MSGGIRIVATLLVLLLVAVGRQIAVSVANKLPQQNLHALTQLRERKR